MKRRQRLSRRSPFRMDTFLPKTAIDYPLLLRKALSPRQLPGARITLSYPNPVERLADHHGHALVLCLEEGRDEGLQIGGAHPAGWRKPPGGSSNSKSPWLLVAISRRGASPVGAVLAGGAAAPKARRACCCRRQRRLPPPRPPPGPCASGEPSVGGGCGQRSGGRRRRLGVPPHRCRVCGLSVLPRGTPARRDGLEATRLGHYPTVVLNDH